MTRDRPRDSAAGPIDTATARCCDLAIPPGPGKGWAKGLSAARDSRVARVAAAHRGLHYERRTPLTECKWFRGGVTTLPLWWSDAMAYVVGLTATDGCLVSSRPRIDFKSADRQLVETYVSLLGRNDRIAAAATRAGGVAFVVQITDRSLRLVPCGRLVAEKEPDDRRHRRT
jgi:hypothetical protein